MTGSVKSHLEFIREKEKKISVHDEYVLILNKFILVFNNRRAICVKTVYLCTISSVTRGKASHNF